MTSVEASKPEAQTKTRSARSVTVRGDSLGAGPVRLDRVIGLDVVNLSAVRKIRTGRLQGSMSGTYFSTKMRCYQMSESDLESFWLMHADFDPGVEAFSAQGLEFGFDSKWAPRKKYTPDLVKRRTSGKIVISEVKSPTQKLDMEFYRPFADTLAEAGWEFELLIEPVRGWRNLRQLHAFGRHHPRPAHVESILDATSERSVTVDALAGDGPDRPQRLGTISYLLWWHDLTADLTRPIDGKTLVSISSAGYQATLNGVANRVLGDQ